RRVSACPRGPRRAAPGQRTPSCATRSRRTGGSDVALARNEDRGAAPVRDRPAGPAAAVAPGARGRVDRRGARGGVRRLPHAHAPGEAGTVNLSWSGRRDLAVYDTVSLRTAGGSVIGRARLVRRTG